MHFLNNLCFSIQLLRREVEFQLHAFLLRASSFGERWRCSSIRGGGPAACSSLRIPLKKVSYFRRRCGGPLFQSRSGGPAPYNSLRILLMKVSFLRGAGEERWWSIISQGDVEVQHHTLPLRILSGKVNHLRRRNGGLSNAQAR